MDPARCAAYALPAHCASPQSKVSRLEQIPYPQAEIAILALHEVLSVLAHKAGTLIRHRVLFHAQKADRVVDEQIPLHLIWKMSARHELKS